MSREKYAVSLTGGLGNQLFQLAVGLKILDKSDTPLLLESGIGKPRLNDYGLPEIASFYLPTNVTLEIPRKSSWLVAKSMGYVLRMGVAPRGYEKLRIVRSCVTFLSSLIGTIYFRGYRKLIYGEGLGYCELERVGRRQILIGYFQSHFWAEDVRETLMNIKPKHVTKLFDELINTTESKKILAVHIRRGDYKLEDSFGLLTKEYYRQCIFEAMSLNYYSEIWLYSDTPNEARDFIPTEYIGLVFEVPGSLSTSETFELMRHAKGYVVANSTFSWWAAFLSYNHDSSVYAPEPWFKNIDDPMDLIPKKWETRRGH